MTDSEYVQIQVEQNFRASAERVFDAWFDPQLLGQWMFGPKLREEEILSLKCDPRVGGTFSFLVRRQGQEIDHVGTYREVDRPRRLVFTWGVGEEAGDESVVTIEITPHEKGCELKLTHRMDAKWSEYADRTQAGWTKMLGAMAEVLAESK